jgi:hypothetical protein
MTLFSRSEWGSASLVIVSLVVFQFIHWFKPSEPYLVSYAQTHGISNDVVIDQVYPWYTYTLLPCTVLAGLIFEVFGHSAALLCAAVADVFSVALVVPATASNLSPFIASELAFSLSFTSLFLVTATLSTLLAPTDYQKASSYNRAATLISTMSSALIGQALVDANRIGDTVWVSLGFSIVSVVGLVACIALGFLRGLTATTELTAQRGGIWGSYWTNGFAALAGLKLIFRDASTVMLCATLAIFLATHTLALTYWQSLFQDIAPEESQNGSILAAAYAASALAAWLPSLSRVDNACMRHAPLISIIATAATGLLLMGMRSTSQLGIAAACFVAYHALAEASLVVLNAQLGRRVAAAAGPMQQQVSDSAQASDKHTKPQSQGPSVPMVQHELQRHGASMLHGNDTQTPLLLESTPDKLLAASSPRPRFGAVFSAVTFVSQAFQIVLQEAIGPHGAKMELSQRYFVFAAVICALSATLVLFSIGRQCRRPRSSVEALA